MRDGYRVNVNSNNKLNDCPDERHAGNLRTNCTRLGNFVIDQFLLNSGHVKQSHQWNLCSFGLVYSNDWVRGSVWICSRFNSISRDDRIYHFHKRFKTDFIPQVSRSKKDFPGAVKELLTT